MIPSTLRRVRRLTPLILVLLAACSPAVTAATSTTADIGEQASTTPPTTVASNTETTSSAAATSTTEETCPIGESDRPMAPDFTLELGDGGEYTLSDNCRPVFMVFWAEW